MKTKLFLLIAGAAVVTLSFTFASTRVEKKEVVTRSAAAANEPAGGFAFEDK